MTLESGILGAQEKMTEGCSICKEKKRPGLEQSKMSIVKFLKNIVEKKEILSFVMTQGPLC